MFNIKKFVENQLRNNSSLIKLSNIDTTQINLNKYLKLDELDTKKSSLNIEYQYKNRKFSRLIHSLLFETYPDKLGLNEDKTKKGILNVHPLNKKTNWSILNYFAGHKFLQDMIISLFVELHKPDKYNPIDFYNWVITNSRNIFGEGEILNELVECNMSTYLKGNHTELLLIDRLESLGYGVQYFCPGSIYDREHGIDIIVTFSENLVVSFQVKDLIGISTNKNSHVFFTAKPKSYIGNSVNKIFLLNPTTLDYVSFPNDNYIIDVPKKAYIVDKGSPIKFGNINNL